MLMEFNKADWPVDDKEWLKNRKEQWRELEQTMRCLQYKRKNVVLFKDYFIKGEINWDDYYACSISSGAGLFLLMRMHPRQEIATLRRILFSCTDRYKFDKCWKAFDLWYSASIRAAQGDVYLALGQDGAFGGKDQLYAELFYGSEFPPPLPLDRDGNPLPNPVSADGMYVWIMRASYFFMLGVTRYRYALAQYMAEYWYSLLPLVKYFTPDSDKEYIVRFLQSVYYFDELAIPDELPARRQLAIQFLEILENRPLPEKLQTLWQRVKSSEGRDFSTLKENRDFWYNETGLPAGSA